MNIIDIIEHFLEEEYPKILFRRWPIYEHDDPTETLEARSHKKLLKLRCHHGRSEFVVLIDSLETRSWGDYELDFNHPKFLEDLAVFVEWWQSDGVMARVYGLQTLKFSQLSQNHKASHEVF